MDASTRRQRAPAGFTLVEMLTVVAIIGILAALITSAAIVARLRVKQTVVLVEIGEFEKALIQYKTEYGAFPPDFFGVNRSDSVGDAARARVLRHLRKAFPRYVPLGDPSIPTASKWAKFRYDVSNNYGLDPQQLDPASAMVFWLGGLPEEYSAGSTWLPRGFHANPQFPFKQGLPRTEPLFDFDADRIQIVDAAGRPLRYYPEGIGGAPYAYFKARRFAKTGRYEYGVDSDPTTTGLTSIIPLSYVHQSGNIAVPYLELKPGEGTPNGSDADLADPTYRRQWRKLETVQIICAGFDGLYGAGLDLSTSPPSSPSYFRYSKSGYRFSADGSDLNNLTNFAGGKLEDEIE